ncbi:unnamed protein product [Somion occarium]|uniref:Uncharacterized protein n=1 Tax=Somion occarium TaxID=3059160 RepID=A0ABP1CGM2_9APHY
MWLSHTCFTLPFCNTRYTVTMGWRNAFKKQYKLFYNAAAHTKLLAGLGTAKAGSRAFPNTTRDKSVGFRLDYGERTGGGLYRNLVLQLNRKSDVPTLSKKADEDSHAKRSTVKVEIANPPSDPDALLGMLLDNAIDN